MSLTLSQWAKSSLSTTSTFKTHLNYIKCVDSQFDDCEITINVRTDVRLDNKKISKFESLARITLQGIGNEASLITQQMEYAQVVAPWIPVKCYYRLYYLESILLFLLSGEEAVFKQGGHTSVRRNLQINLKSNAISFGNAELNRVVSIGSATQYKGTAGANVRSGYHQSTDCVKAVRKKLSQYKEHNFKESKTAKNYWKTKKGHQEREEFVSKEAIALADYFYWMRIKANYKDIDFLDFDNISGIH
jgi:hypothetical protein